MLGAASYNDVHTMIKSPNNAFLRTIPIGKWLMTVILIAASFFLEVSFPNPLPPK